MGLHCNTKKTECMAIGVCRPEASLEIATKQEIAVKARDGTHRKAWMVDWIARAEVTQEKNFNSLDMSKFKTQPTHLIIYEGGQHGAIEMRGNGWIMDQNGDKHRINKLGRQEFVDDKANKFKCEVCRTVFSSERAINSHKSRCRRPEDMTIKERVKLGKTRQLNAKRACREVIKIENIDIIDASGLRLRPVAEFTYLGTMTTTRVGSSREIKIRMGVACSVFASLWRVWDSEQISLKLKSDLFKALVATIVLYNSECWVVSKDDLRRLEGFLFRSARRITRRTRCPSLGDKDVDKVSKAKVFKLLKLSSAEEMIREKRLKWFGHLVRQEDDDLARETLMKLIKKITKWRDQLVEDFAVRKITEEKALSLAMDRAKWRQISRVRTPPMGAGDARGVKGRKLTLEHHQTAT